mgnify:CR=1 FL=1
MNIIDIQDNLKNLPEQALMQEMQQPTGSAPQFLVLGELKRRKQMRDDYNRQKNADMKTVAEEVVTAAGAPQEGIMQMARSLNPNTNMAQDTGLAQAAPVTPTQAPQPQAPQMMSDGGIMRLQTGGTISAIANLKVNHPEIYEEYKGNPESLALAAEYFLNVPETPAQTVMESSEKPREYDLLKRMFSDPTRGDIIDQQKRDAAEFGADYALDQSDQSLFNQQQAELAGNEMLFAEGAPVEYLTGNVSAGIGGSAVPFAAADTPASAALTQPVSPEIADFIPPQSPTADIGVRTLSGGASPLQANMTDVLPDVSIANARADADRDDLLGYLRGEYKGSDLPAIIDAIDRNNMDEGGFRTTSDRVIRDDLGGGHSPAYFPNDRVIAPLNRRAQAYMQSDMYTPPEQIYDLSPRGRLKYEEAGDEEFAAVSDRLAREDTADAIAKEDAFFASEDARLDAQRAADRAIGRRISMDQPLDPDAQFADSAARAFQQGRDKSTSFLSMFDDLVDAGSGYFDARLGGMPGPNDADAADGPNLVEQDSSLPMDTGEPLTVPSAEEGGIGSLLPPKATSNDTGTGTGEGTGTSTGVGSSGRIAQMLEDRQKSAESDKWMALAQTGLALMASDQPTLGGAIGEAGLAGIGALQQSRQGMQDFEMDMLKLQTQIDAANRKSGSKGGLTAGNIISYVDDLARQQSDVRDKLDELDTGVFTGTEEQKEAIRKRLQTNLFQVGLELSTYRNALRGGQPSSGSAFDVTGGSQSTGN